MKKQRTSGHIDFVEFPAPSVAALQETKAFLHASFGWSFEDWGDDYADISGSGVASGLNAAAEHRPEHPLVVIYTTDIEDVRKRVLGAGGEIVKEIFRFPGGTRFHFREPSGNVMAVWSDR